MKVKQLLLGLSIVLSANTFAYNCEELASLSSIERQVVVDLARNSTMNIINSSVNDVSQKIRAERDMELSLLACQQVALKKLSTALINGELSAEEVKIPADVKDSNCLKLAYLSDSSQNAAISLSKSIGLNTIDSSVNDVSQKIRAERDMELYLLRCEQVTAQEKTYLALKRLGRNGTNTSFVDDGARNNTKENDIKSSKSLESQSAVIRE